MNPYLSDPSHGLPLSAPSHESFFDPTLNEILSRLVSCHYN